MDLAGLGVRWWCTQAGQVKQVWGSSVYHLLCFGLQGHSNACPCPVSLCACVQAMAMHGRKWSQVAKLVPGRTDVQCRERYMNVLNPGGWVGGC
jgi:hypothetical protein